MSIFDSRRLTNDVFRLDIEGLRRGFYTDKYFENVVRILESLRAARYQFAGTSPRELPMGVSQVSVGDIQVERRYSTGAPQP
jgi:nicotinate phosphoribosyltransferase